MPSPKRSRKLLKWRLYFGYRADPTCGCDLPSNNQKIIGADNEVYKVPDINQAGNRYYFNWKYEFNTISGSYEKVFVTYFPLIDLEWHPGPWRLVMSDDDKDYPSFSRRRQSEFQPNINTYDMSTGNYGSVETGFTVQRKTYGSSDDPRWASGVRKITINNAQARINNNKITVNTVSEGNQFEYVFGLESY